MIRTTQPLKPFNKFDQIHPDVLDYASERGTTIHHACHVYGQGGFVLTSQWPPDYHGFFYSYMNWFDKYVEKVIDTEIELIDEDLDLVGHPDLLCIIIGDTKITLVDLKTPLAESFTWKPQLSCYRHLAIKNGYDIGRVGSLRLKGNGGRAIFSEYTDSAADFAAYMNMLMIEKYRLSEGGK